MPYRKTLIVPDQIYHIFNRSIARQPSFLSKKDYQRFQNIMDYYRFQKPPLRFSHFIRLPLEQRTAYETQLKQRGVKQVGILAFCIMSNHIHFLLKENTPKGIAYFMKNIQESYAKYHNTKHERTGSLFQSMFKAVRIETDNQLLHVARYIHLNPYTSFVVKTKEELLSYPQTSLPEYLAQPSIITTEIILSHFSNKKQFTKFTLDQADYQRRLGEIKHLVFE